MVKNTPFNAGDTSSILGQGTKIPYASGLLRLRAETREKSTQRNESPAGSQLRSNGAKN